MVLTSFEAFWDDKPDGNLYASARPWIDERITVSAEGDADPLIDRLIAVAAEQQIGEVMELRAASTRSSWCGSTPRPPPG